MNNDAVSLSDYNLLVNALKQSKQEMFKIVKNHTETIAKLEERLANETEKRIKIEDQAKRAQLKSRRKEEHLVGRLNAAEAELVLLKFGLLCSFKKK